MLPIIIVINYRKNKDLLHFMINKMIKNKFTMYQFRLIVRIRKKVFLITIIFYHYKICHHQIKFAPNLKKIAINKII